MTSDDGEWIRDQAADGPGATEPDEGWLKEGSPDEAWPDEAWPDEAWPDEAWPDEAWPAAGGSAGTGSRRGHRDTPGLRGRVAAMVAVIAAAAGATAGFFLVREMSPATSAPGAAPAASASAPSSGGEYGSAGQPSAADLPVLPALSGGGNGQLRLVLTGRVLAIGRTSISIGGDGPVVFAGITRATKVSGTAHNIGGVKVGDEISAEITGTSTRLTVIAIRDPASTA
ncbi:MAG: hypothetical protein WAK82_36915 [Streptosporangiaceae bacterium]